MNEHVKIEKWLEMGEGSGYNGTDVLFNKGGTMMKMTATYPEDCVQEMAMEAFEAVMVRLKAHPDAEVRELAQAADASFLLWTLAGEETAIATQTIGEYLPILIRVRGDGQGQARRPAPTGVSPIDVGGAPRVA
jgi:hypothetical protein